MIVYNCDTGCGAWTTQLLGRNKLAVNKSGNGTFYKHIFSLAPNTGQFCEHCGSKTHMAGPMYAGPLHSPSFIQRILKDLPNVSKDTYVTKDRIEGMLSLALEETLVPLKEQQVGDLAVSVPEKDGEYDPVALDHYPFFFIPSVLSKVIHCITPHENALRGAIRHLGYRVTRSHTKAGSIKTDAPWSVIWEIMREWVKQKEPIKVGAVREGTAGYKILRMDTPVVQTEHNALLADGDTDMERDKDRTALEIVFDEELGKERDSKKLVRYQLNPRENWGPMNRAKGH
jgi:tRNA (guanine26-N2/guanine27-N2)-dimethyltransferase